MFTANFQVETIAIELASFAEAVVSQKEKESAVEHAMSTIAAWQHVDVSKDKRLAVIRSNYLSQAKETIKLYA